MILENFKLKLRAIEPEDLDVLYKWENDTSQWRNGCTLSPYSKLSLREYINNTLSQDIYESHQLRLMVCLKNEESAVIGTVDIYDLDPKNLRAGIGILIDEKYRGQKYASEVLEIIREYAFNFLNLRQLYAYILCDNEISKKLFKKAGYSHVGLLKDWNMTGNNSFKDVLLVQLLAPINND